VIVGAGQVCITIGIQDCNLTSLRFFPRSSAVISTVLRADALAGRVLFSAGVTFAPNSPIAPNSIDGTKRSIALLNLLEFVSFAIVTAILGSLALTRALSLAASAGFGAGTPDSPRFPLPVDRTGTLVALPVFPVGAVAIQTTIEWSMTSSGPLGNPTGASFGAIAPLSPRLPSPVDGTFDDVAILHFLSLPVAVFSAVEGTFALSRPLLFATAAVFAAVAPNRPFSQDSVDRTLGGSAFCCLQVVADALRSSVEGSFAGPLPRLGAASAGRSALFPRAPLGPFAVDRASEVVAPLRLFGVADARVPAVCHFRACASALADASSARNGTCGPG